MSGQTTDTDEGDFFQIFRKDVQLATAGENVGLQLRGIKASAVEKGMLVIQPGSFEPTNHFEATIYLLGPGEGGRHKPVTSKYAQVIFVDTWNLPFRLDLPVAAGRDMVMPGEQATVRLTLMWTMPLFEGQAFTLRENQITVATGVITKLMEPVVGQKGHKMSSWTIPNLEK